MIENLKKSAVQKISDLRLKAQLIDERIEK